VPPAVLGTPLLAGQASHRQDWAGTGDVADGSGQKRDIVEKPIFTFLLSTFLVSFLINRTRYISIRITKQTNIEVVPTIKQKFMNFSQSNISLS
jgi:hypothetical protein